MKVSNLPSGTTFIDDVALHNMLIDELNKCAMAYILPVMVLEPVSFTLIIYHFFPQYPTFWSRKFIVFFMFGQVLEHDGANVSVLVQRALLYESMEKYKLGAEDLRTVLKIDPANRIARSTIHRLTKMVD